MKLKRAFVGTLAGLSLLGLSAGAVVAGPHGGCGGEQHAAAFGKHGGGFGMLRHLDLTDAQRGQIEEIVSGRKDAMRAQKQALRESRKALREAAASEQFDAERVRELADAHARAMADLMVARAETYNQVQSVLTPEQRQALAERKAQRMEAHGGHERDGEHRHAH